MTENQLAIIKKALVNLEEKEARLFEGLPKVDFQHSEKYERKIKKLLEGRRERAGYTPRKIAAILIAATLIFALSITAFAFRENIKDFFIEIYEDCFVISASTPENELLPTKIESFYTVYDIPDGFSKIADDESEIIAQQAWTSDTGMVALQQTLAKGAEISASNQNASFEETKLGDKELFWIKDDHGFQVFWTENGYIFTLNVFGEFSSKDVENMILSIAPKESNS